MLSTLQKHTLLTLKYYFRENFNTWSGLYRLFDIIVLLSFTGVSVYGLDFPDRSSVAGFKSDLQQLALIINPPTLPDADHYVGLQMSGSAIATASDGLMLLPSARLAIYPNPDYSMWLHMAIEPAVLPQFSVGTGIQIQLPVENRHRREAVGLAWNQVSAADYLQRDITLHGLYGYTGARLDAGLVLIMDLHHVLVEDDLEMPDYDATNWQAASYIGWMLQETIRAGLVLAVDHSGAGLVITFEYLLAKRS